MVWIAFLVVHLLIALPVTAATALDESPALHSAIGEYDMFQRPDPKGVPTEVSVGPYVVDIADISDVDRHVTVDFSLLMRWRDTRLAVGSEEGGTSLRRFKLTDVWNPHVLFVNQRRLFKEGEDTVTVAPEGRVRYEQRQASGLFRPILHFSGRAVLCILCLESNRSAGVDCRHVVDGFLD